MLAFICVLFNLGLIGLVGNLVGLTGRYLIQPEAFILVFSPQILFALASLCLRKGYPFCRRLVSDSLTLNDDELIEAMVSLGLIYGFIGGCMGTAICLGQLPDPKSIGRGIAFAMGSLFYGIVPSLLVFTGRIKGSLLHSSIIRTYIIIAVCLLVLCGATVIVALLKH